jgi:hypothetical protein
MKNLDGDNGSSRADHEQPPRKFELVQLKDLRPNPLRDFSVDPIQGSAIEELVKSIKEEGFWGGVTLRRNKNGQLEIAAGITRIQAAIEAGETEALLHVRDAEDLTDEKMILTYARENALQRGNTGPATAGVIASTIRFLAKEILLGGKVAGEIASNFDLEKIRRNLGNENGIGRPLS